MTTSTLFDPYDQIQVYCNVHFMGWLAPEYHWSYSVTWITDTGESRNSNVGCRATRKEAETAVLILAAKIAAMLNRQPATSNQQQVT